MACVSYYDPLSLLYPDDEEMTAEIGLGQGDTSWVGKIVVFGQALLVGIPMDVMPQLLQKPPDPPDINARTDPNIFISNVKEYYFIVYISTFNRIQMVNLSTVVKKDVT